MTYRGIDLNEKIVFDSENIFDENIVYIEQRFKTMGEFRFVELLNPKLFPTYEKKKKIDRSVFNFRCMKNTYWILKDRNAS